MRWCIDAGPAAKSKRDGPPSGASNEEMKKKKKRKGSAEKGGRKEKMHKMISLGACRLANSLAHLSSSGGASLPHVKRRFFEYNFNHVAVVFEKSKKFPTCLATVS